MKLELNSYKIDSAPVLPITLGNPSLISTPCGMNDNNLWHHIPPPNSPPLVGNAALDTASVTDNANDDNVADAILVIVDEVADI